MWDNVYRECVPHMPTVEEREGSSKEGGVERRGEGRGNKARALGEGAREGGGGLRHLQGKKTKETKASYCFELPRPPCPPFGQQLMCPPRMRQGCGRQAGRRPGRQGRRVPLSRGKGKNPWKGGSLSALSTACDGGACGGVVLRCWGVSVFGEQFR